MQLLDAPSVDGCNTNCIFRSDLRNALLDFPRSTLEGCVFKQVGEEWV